MKSRKIKIISSFILITFAILLQTCKKEWNQHYEKQPSQAAGTSLADYIHSVPELSKFYQMLQITGCDSLLNASQTYTVWAPDNDALQNVDLNDKTLVSDIVKNHIARYANPTSGIQSKYIRTINGKLILFNHETDGFHFGHALINSSDKLTANGVLHILDSYVPFQNNIWEYINRNKGFDSLRAYINSQHKKIFNQKASLPVSIDSLGNRIYDSVFIETNALFNSIGDLDIEDSIYTAILPNNAAWTDAYNRIKPYFVSNNPTMAGAIQRSYTQLCIVRDMVFRGRVSSPASFDSLQSTFGDVFHQPDYLFNGITANEASNGLIYATSQMKYKPTDSWLKNIKVEAEYSYGRSNVNSNIYRLYSYGSSLTVSNKSYIKIEPTTTADISKVYVDFSIPNTLSAKYNIYCVFVPGSVSNSLDMLPNRATFYLLTLNGKTVLNQPLNVQNNITDPNGITKMLLVQGFKLPNCDLYLDSNTNNSANIKLRVMNDVGILETGFSRTMRIDYILFEPVAE